MRTMWLTREIEAPAVLLWDLLIDTEQWPRWGPSIRSVSASGGRHLHETSTGTVTTALGLALSFTVTDWDDGSRWSWNVAGVAATSHTVEALTPTRCRVGFGVPALAMPYLVVCRIALRSLDRLATEPRLAA